MIKAEFHLDIKNRALTLKVTGHAGQAEEGKDIVCASASILAYTLAKNVEECGYSEFFEKEPTIMLEKGDAEITCNPKKDTMTTMLSLYGAFWEGYKILAQEYPQYVEILI